MKKLFWVILSVIILLVISAHELTQPMRVKDVEYDIYVSEDRLKRDVLALSTIEGARMYANKKGLKEASNYIKNEFEKLSLNVTKQQYEIGNDTVENIIAQYGSSKTKQLIIGAHYDVCGDQAGADDNASGVAGLL